MGVHVYVADGHALAALWLNIDRLYGPLVTHVIEVILEPNGNAGFLPYDGVQLAVAVDIDNLDILDLLGVPGLPEFVLCPRIDRWVMTNTRMLIPPQARAMIFLAAHNVVISVTIHIGDDDVVAIKVSVAVDHSLLPIVAPVIILAAIVPCQRAVAPSTIVGPPAMNHNVVEAVAIDFADCHASAVIAIDNRVMKIWRPAWTDRSYDAIDTPFVERRIVYCDRYFVLTCRHARRIPHERKGI